LKKNDENAAQNGDQDKVHAQGANPIVQGGPPEDDSNSRSVFVKNVHFSTTEEQMRKHVRTLVDENAPDEIKRVTILKNKMTMQPIGNWYIEFNTETAAKEA